MAITAIASVPSGNVDFLGVIYKDGKFKSKTRILFPSGAKMVFSAEGESPDEIAKRIQGAVSSFPDIIEYRFTKIPNISTKGSDLWNEMLKSPLFKFRTVEQE